MKKYLVFSLLFTTLFSCTKSCGYEINPNSITYFTFSTQNYMIRNGDYILTCEECEGIETVSVKYSEASPDEVVTVETDGTVLSKIGEVIVKYNMKEWDNFHETNYNVLDGDGFYLTVMADEELLISASGSNSYPKNYAKATDEIKAIFHEVLTDNGLEP